MLPLLQELADQVQVRKMFTGVALQQIASDSTVILVDVVHGFAALVVHALARQREFEQVGGAVKAEVAAVQHELGS